VYRCVKDCASQPAIVLACVLLEMLCCAEQTSVVNLDSVWSHSDKFF